MEGRACSGSGPRSAPGPDQETGSEMPGLPARGRASPPLRRVPAACPDLCMHRTLRNRTVSSAGVTRARRPRPAGRPSPFQDQALFPARARTLPGMRRVGPARIPPLRAEPAPHPDRPAGCPGPRSNPDSPGLAVRERMLRPEREPRLKPAGRPGRRRNSVLPAAARPRPGDHAHPVPARTLKRVSVARSRSWR